MIIVIRESDKAKLKKVSIQEAIETAFSEGNALGLFLDRYMVVPDDEYDTAVWKLQTGGWSFREYEEAKRG